MFGKKYRRVLGLGVAFAAMLTLLVGAVRAQDSSVIVIGYEQEPDVLPPGSQSTFSQVTQGLFQRNVWDWDENYQIFPVMVSEVPTAENGGVTTDASGNTVVTYKLREGMKWSDGEPITADDCLFGDKLFRDTSTGTVFRSDYPNVVANVEKTDDLTVVQTFNVPYPDYTSTNAYLHCEYPAHVLQPLMDANGGSIDGLSFFTNGEGVVGYGPYKLESWTHGDNLTFVANENWDGSAPIIPKVILKVITDSNQMQNAFTNGEIDVAFNWANNLAEGYKAAPNAVVWNLPEVYADALWFNVDAAGHQNPAMQDINVRKAIVMAINRVDSTHLIQGPDLSVPAAFDAVNWWPEGLTTIAYDPDAAMKALDDAGWTDSDGDGIRDKDGVKLSLKFLTTPRQDRIDYQTAIAADLKKVGIDTQQSQVDGPTVLFASWTNNGAMALGDYDMVIYASSNDPISPNADPQSLTCAGVPSTDNPDGANYSHWCSPEFDALVDQVKTNTDPVSRLEQKHQAVQIMTDAVFWNGLYQRVWWVAVAGDRFDAESFKGTFGTLNSNWLQKPENWKPVS